MIRRLTVVLLVSLCAAQQPRPAVADAPPSAEPSEAEPPQSEAMPPTATEADPQPQEDGNSPAPPLHPTSTLVCMTAPLGRQGPCVSIERDLSEAHGEVRPLCVPSQAVHDQLSPPGVPTWAGMWTMRWMWTPR